MPDLVVVGVVGMAAAAAVGMEVGATAEETGATPVGATAVGVVDTRPVPGEDMAAPAAVAGSAAGVRPVGGAGVPGRSPAVGATLLPAVTGRSPLVAAGLSGVGMLLSPAVAAGRPRPVTAPLPLAAVAL